MLLLVFLAASLAVTEAENAHQAIADAAAAGGVSGGVSGDVSGGNLITGWKRNIDFLALGYGQVFDDFQ